MILTDARVKNPLHLEELPSTKLELKALEGAIIDTLISIHYTIEDTKRKIASSLLEGLTDKVRALIAKKGILLEKKRVLTRRLEKVQAKFRSL